ncbi:glycosyltransferase family 2 protein [Paracoccus tibetensis]|uniref:Glycosyltransferase n=1 Tax=Paracoccus tibetensis TaxID=336292 RepID=A0A1G5DRA4_9RHOB|nr:glycosyltransferase family 2 protein [Paracoccus tibetensis]SCY17194.1 glycosyltransferase [Paracoccus tibetensis]
MKISVVTAVYNRADTVGQAIASVQAQVYPHVEHLIIDGGSTDKTIENVRKYSRAAMRVISEPDEGIYDALNKGIANSTGDVIGVMHSDDFFADAFVLDKVAHEFADPAVGAVYGDLDYVSASDPTKIVRHWKSGNFSKNRLRWGWMPPHPTLFLRRDVFVRLGSYDTSYRIAADYDAILRFLGKGGVRARYIPEVLVKMRVGGESNKSLDRVIRKSREDYRALRSSGMGGAGALIWKNVSKIPQFILR